MGLLLLPPLLPASLLIFAAAGYAVHVTIE